MKLELSKSQINDLVEMLLEKINKDEFTIVNRDKNIIFLRKYHLNQQGVKEKILSKISSSNFISEEFDNDTIKYGKEKVAIFIIECDLVDLYGNKNCLKVYVKIKEKIDKLITISIHESEG